MAKVIGNQSEESPETKKLHSHEEFLDEENNADELTRVSKEPDLVKKPDSARSQHKIDFGQAVHELQRIWFIAVLAGVFHVFMMLEVNFFLPYLYSRVHCCQNGESLHASYDITDDQSVASVLAHAHSLGLPVEVMEAHKGIAACNVPRFPPSSPQWSLSPHCVNRAYVHDSTQGLMARIKPLQKAVALLLLPVGGNLADSVGRRPVLALYACLLLLASSLAAVDCWVESRWGSVPVLVASMMLSASFQPKDTIISSSIADIVGNVEAEKSRAFSGLMAMNTGVNLACLMATYHSMRMHLTNYATPWMSFACLAGGMLLLLATVQETLPSELRQSLTREMLDPIRGQVKGLRLLAQDPVLVQLSIITFLFWAFFVGFNTTRLSYLIMVGFTLEEAIFPEMVACIFGIFFSGVMVTLLPKIGTLRAICMSFAFWIVSFFLWGPCTVYFGRSVAYPAAVFQQASFLTLLSSVPTAVSQRVGKSHQATCQASLQALGGVGAMISVPIYNKFLFSATAQGLARALPSLVSLVLATICLLLSLRIASSSTSSRVAPAEGL